ncbi:MAG: hypothetical protein ACOCWH_06970 [Spirochaetota bacterium]
MKRHLTWTGIIMIMTLLSAGCTQESFRDLFTLKSVRRVTQPTPEAEVEELREMARGYEDEINEKIEALGIKFLLRQNWQLAVESLKKAITYGNTSDDVHRHLGIAYANRAREINQVEDYRKAVYHYERALEINSGNVSARFGLGMVLFYGLEERKKGLAETKMAAEGDAAFFDARFAYGRMLYDLDRKSEALRVYQGILEDLENAPSEEYDQHREDVRQNINQLTVELSNDARQ